VRAFPAACAFALLACALPAARRDAAVGLTADAPAAVGDPTLAAGVVAGEPGGVALEAEAVTRVAPRCELGRALVTAASADRE